MISKLIQRFCTYKSLKQQLKQSSISSPSFSQQLSNKCKQYLKLDYKASIPHLRKQKEYIQYRYYQYLIINHQTSQLLSIMFELRKQLISLKGANIIKEYLLPRFNQELSEYQKQFVSYYYLLLRDPVFFHKVLEPKQPEELILYNYSALMNGKEQLIKTAQHSIGSDNYTGTFWKQSVELKCYLQPNYQLDNKNIFKYHKRSKLQEEVELILRNLKIPFKREQSIKCYKVDFIVQQAKVLEILGPSHYIPWSHLLRGDQDVRKKIIEKQNFQYITIGHHQWSKLKGLQEQRDFIRLKLNGKKKMI